DRIAFHTRDIWTRCERLGNLAAAFHQNRVHDVERAMLDAALPQPLQNRSLRCLGLVPQRIVHVAALLGLSRQSCCAAQVSLIGEHNKKFSFLTIRCVRNYPWRDLTVERVVLNALAKNAALPPDISAF